MVALVERQGHPPLQVALEAKGTGGIFPGV